MSRNPTLCLFISFDPPKYTTRDMFEKEGSEKPLAAFHVLIGPDKSHIEAGGTVWLWRTDAAIRL